MIKLIVKTFGWAAIVAAVGGYLFDHITMRRDIQWLRTSQEVRDTGPTMEDKWRGEVVALKVEVAELRGELKAMTHE